MYPFIDFGFTIVAAYDLMAVIGIILSFILIIVLNKKKDYSLPMVDIILLFLFILIGVYLGGRLLFAITQIPNMISNPEIIAAVFLLGGQVFYGGLIGGIGGGLLYVKLYGLDPIRYINLAIIAVPLGHGCGRIGCYLTGCCHGKPTESVLGVSFPAGPSHIEATVPLHPTQLYETVFNFLLLATLITLFFRKKMTKPYFIPAVYLLAYSSFRFFIEFFRGDEVRGIFILSTSQWISVVLFIFGILLMLGKFDDHPLLNQTTPWSKGYRQKLIEKKTENNR